ncbi:hypothetical protein DNTS_005740 [Danionella cerebrum]|uniref:Uncharacterized protein n=1 Tax=Danionella cerebrum TaxID=2873325 RepID=A0A553QU32_9TELE|nr:hypothetical protein DNTS_005740 [Danionella translucida]
MSEPSSLRLHRLIRKVSISFGKVASSALKKNNITKFPNVHWRVRNSSSSSPVDATQTWQAYLSLFYSSFIPLFSHTPNLRNQPYRRADAVRRSGRRRFDDQNLRPINSAEMVM